jgi:hypothetical protein
VCVDEDSGGEDTGNDASGVALEFTLADAKTIATHVAEAFR